MTRCAADNEGIQTFLVLYYESRLMKYAVDWHLYGQVLRTLIELMNILSRHVMSRFDNVESYTDPLPLLGNDTIQDSQYVLYIGHRYMAIDHNFRAMYEAALAWLDQPGLSRVSSDSVMSLHSHLSLGIGL